MKRLLETYNNFKNVDVPNLGKEILHNMCLLKKNNSKEDLVSCLKESFCDNIRIDDIGLLNRTRYAYIENTTNILLDMIEHNINILESFSTNKESTIGKPLSNMIKNAISTLKNNPDYKIPCISNPSKIESTCENCIEWDYKLGKLLEKDQIDLEIMGERVNGLSGDRGFKCEVFSSDEIVNVDCNSYEEGAKIVKECNDKLMNEFDNFISKESKISEDIRNHYIAAYKEMYNEMEDLSILKPVEEAVENIDNIFYNSIEKAIDELIQKNVRFNIDRSSFVITKESCDNYDQYISQKNRRNATGKFKWDELFSNLEEFCIPENKRFEDNYLVVENPFEKYYISGIVGKDTIVNVCEFKVSDLANDKMKVISEEALKDIKMMNISEEADSYIPKTYNDSYLYSLVSEKYAKKILEFIKTGTEVDKTSEAFDDIIHELKIRRVDSALVSILKSNNIVLMISNMELPMPREFKAFTARDIRPGKTNKKKVFIDVTGILAPVEGGGYKLNYRNVDILVSYLTSGAAQFIYYADPKRFLLNSRITESGTRCFAKLVTFIVDSLIKISVNGNLRDKVLYLSAEYYLRSILRKGDLGNIYQNLLRKISGLGDREIDLTLLSFEEKNFENIKTFMQGLRNVCQDDKLTLDIFINKWMNIYGVGTQFSLELFPSLTTMLVYAYGGQFLNNQPAIEKQCGQDLVEFSKLVLTILSQAVK